MPRFYHRTVFARQSLHPDTCLWIPLLYPEINRLTEDDRELSRQLRERIVEITEGLDQRLLHWRRLNVTPKIQAIRVRLEPPSLQKKAKLWKEPLEQEFYYLVWQQDERHVIAYVPSLDIEVLRVGKDDEKFAGDVRREIRAALARKQTLASFRSLIELDRFGEIELVEHEFDLELPTLKEVAAGKVSESERESELRKVAVRSQAASSHRAYEVFKEKEMVANALAPPAKNSVLIIGPSGCGKTGAVRELAQTRKVYGLEEFEFWETNGARIVAGMSGFGQWQERCQKIIEELSKRQAILHVGSLSELMDVGKSQHQQQGVASFFKSHIQKGGVRLIAECTPDEISLIEKRDPEMLRIFQQVQMEAPKQETKQKIYRRVVIAEGASVDDKSLQKLEGLHHRYATYSASPSRQVRFLRNLIRDQEAETPIVPGHVTKAFAAETGMPEFLLDDQVPLDSKATESWIAERVIGQAEAVHKVVDLMAAIKSELTPTRKPIASFLFIGPTGVGKTEMAKSIAEFMYGDPQRMIRIDMSEYSDPISVNRLFGGLGNESGILTGKVRQNPFSVLLLDEFEKAHPTFFDLLLQVLSEGRLTDGKGRLTEFSTTIIIMTSNIGAQNYKNQSFGFSVASEADDHDRARDHFESEVQKHIRPELYNRIDAIIPFSPLSLETVRRVVDRELEKLLRREGLWYRNVNVKVDSSAASLIAETGRDPRYGARPLQRYIQENIVLPLAEKLNQQPQENRVDIQIRAEGSKLKFGFSITPPNAGDREGAKETGLQMSNLWHLRRRAQKLVNAPIVVRMQNEYYRLQNEFERQLRASRKRRRYQDAEAQKWLWAERQQLEVYERHVEKILELGRTIYSFEDQNLSRYFAQETIDPEKLDKEIRDYHAKINDTLFEIYNFDSRDDPKTIMLMLFGRDLSLVRKLFDSYLRFAEIRNLKVESRFVLQRYREERVPDKAFLIGIDAEPEDDVESSVAQIGPFSELSKAQSSNPSETIGLAFRVRGASAFPMFVKEKGVHFFKNNNMHSKVFVDTEVDDLKEHWLPPDILKLGPFEAPKYVRRYDLTQNVFEDDRHGKFRGKAGEFTADLCECLNQELKMHLEKLIDPWN